MIQSGGIFVLVFDGFADWEPAHALAELRRSAGRNVMTVGFEAKAVTSMGGLRILPDRALGEIEPADVGLFIIPGGDAWESAHYPQDQLATLLRELNTQGTPIAAICGATLALARAGLLNDRRHTSTVPGDLDKAAPSYSGAAHYVHELAVTDRDVITASGLGSVDFARQIFASMRVFSDRDEALWFEMYKYGRLPDTTV